MNRAEFLKKIRLEDKCRDFNWINSLYEKGKLYIDDRLVEEKTFEDLRLFIKTLQEIYTDSWDIELDIYSFTDIENFSISIKAVVILFKDIEIKNSSNKSHKIKDLFVKITLYIEGGRVRINNIEGGRTTISYEEWSSNYFHSHLPGYFRAYGEVAPYYSSFCTGSGHINDHMIELNTSRFKEDKLVPFFIQLLGLVSWESAEGGPHRYFNSISARPTSGRQSNPNQDSAIRIYSTIIEYHKAENKIPDLDFTLEGDRYVLTQNEKFEKFLLESTPLSNNIKNSMLCMRDSTGRYFAYGQLPGYREKPTNIRETYIFQGQVVPVIIGDAPTTINTDESKYEIHPNIIKYIKDKIEYDINFKKIRQSTINRYQNKDDNARESITSDRMAV